MAKKKNYKRTIAIIVSLLLLIGASWAWSVWVRIYDNPPDADDYVRDPLIQDDPEKNITNILILGVDQEGNNNGRADSIIVMSINHDTDDVALISIPRDSRVEIPGRGLDKINHAMAYQGIGLMRGTVEKLLGVPIQHYVYTNFAGFQNIIDAVGGVTLNVERRIVVQNADDTGKITLEPGIQTLTGDGALGYVRFRMDREGDFGRMRRQQQLLSALAREVTQPKNITRLPSLLEQFARHVRTDMTISQLLSFSRVATKLDLVEVATIQLSGTTANIGGVSYVILDEQIKDDTIRRYLRWEFENTVGNI